MQQPQIAGSPEFVEAYLRRLARTAHRTLHMISNSGKAPSDNLAYALRSVHAAYVLVADDQPVAASAKLAAIQCLGLASLQVSQMEAMALEATTTIPRWMLAKAGQGHLQGRTASAWRKNMLTLSAYLGSARLAIEEAAVYINSASAAVAVASHTAYVAGSNHRRVWTQAARHYLTSAVDGLVHAQVSIAGGRASVIGVSESTEALFDIL